VIRCWSLSQPVKPFGSVSSKLSVLRHVGLDHRRVDPHRPRAEALLARRLDDQRARELGDRLGPDPPGQLADRRLVGHPLRQRDPTEAPQVNRVRHLGHQRPISPPIALLEHHQAHVGLDRDRRPPIRQHRPLCLDDLAPPVRHDRRQQLRIRHQRIQRREILRQLAHLDRQRLVPQRLRPPRPERQHTLSPRPRNPSLAGNSGRHAGRNRPLKARSLIGGSAGGARGRTALADWSLVSSRRHFEPCMRFSPHTALRRSSPPAFDFTLARPGGVWARRRFRRG
jgi:hypothetical protein